MILFFSQCRPWPAIGLGRGRVAEILIAVQVAAEPAESDRQFMGFAQQLLDQTDRVGASV